MPRNDSASALQNRVALVTGGGRGIGRAIAIALAREGADVVLSYHERDADAARTAADIEAYGRRALVIRADLSMRGAAAALARQAADAFGGVDILINNAGIIRPQPIEAITESDWDDLIAVNLTSVFLLTQAVVPGMRDRRWGRIVNIASVAAQLGGVVGPHYAASKAGLFGLTHSYAALLAREGITVNTIAPALIETEMVTSNPRARRDLLPVGRFGSADEVASVAVMLASNGYITGQTLNVNGGWYMS
jgi:3-oxoacyl-[acyl-carrier protein] reductase